MECPFELTDSTEMLRVGAQEIETESHGGQRGLLSNRRKIQKEQQEQNLVSLRQAYTIIRPAACCRKVAAVWR